MSGFPFELWCQLSWWGIYFPLAAVSPVCNNKKYWEAISVLPQFLNWRCSALVKAHDFLRVGSFSALRYFCLVWLQGVVLSIHFAVATLPGSYKITRYEILSSVLSSAAVCGHLYQSNMVAETQCVWWECEVWLVWPMKWISNFNWFQWQALHETGGYYIGQCTHRHICQIESRFFCSCLASFFCIPTKASNSYSIRCFTEFLFFQLPAHTNTHYYMFSPDSGAHRKDGWSHVPLSGKETEIHRSES